MCGISFQRGLLRIPIDKIEGLEPDISDWVDEKGNIRRFQKGERIRIPIEVEYHKDGDTFILYNGNHRVKQAKINGETSILAFVEVANKDYDSLQKYGLK